MKKKFGLLLLVTVISFLLIGCDLGGTTITTPTASTPTTTTTTTTLTTTTTTTSEPFDRNDLLSIIEEQMGGDVSTEELNANITMMMSLLGIETEEDLYNMMLNLETLMGELVMIESASDLRTWWTAVKASGFDQLMISETLMNLMTTGVDLGLSTMSVEDIEAMIAEYDEIIDDLLVEESELFTEMINYHNDVVYAYAISLPSNSSDALSYYDALLTLDELEDNYYEELAFMMSDNIDYGLLWELESNIDDYFYYSAIGSEDAQSYLEANTALLLNVDNASDYEYLMTYYRDYQEVQAVIIPDYEEMLWNVLDNNSESVSSVIMNMKYDYDSLSYELESLSWEIENAYYTQEELQSQIMTIVMLGEFDAYLQDVESLVKLGVLVNTLYSTVDDLIMGISDETFDYFFSMMNSEYMVMLETPEDLVTAINAIVEIATLLHDSVDETEKANLQVVIIDLGTMYINALELPVEETEAMLTLLENQVGEYFTTLDSIFVEVLGYVDSLTVADFTLIQEYSELIADSETTDSEAAIVTAELMVVLLGNDRLDTDMLLSVLVESMLNATTNFTATESEITLTQAEVIGYFDDVLANAQIVALLDAENLSVSDLDAIEALKTSIMTLSEYFSYNQVK